MLTDVIDTRFVRYLDNDLPPMLLSCSCLAGNFADVANSADHADWTVQGHRPRVARTRHESE